MHDTVHATLVRAKLTHSLSHVVTDFGSAHEVHALNIHLDELGETVLILDTKQGRARSRSSR
jgi:hypothetical protein